MANERSRTTASPWRIGDRIEASWSDGLFYPGLILKVNKDSTCDILFDDGDEINGHAAEEIRLYTTPVKRRRGPVEEIVIEENDSEPRSKRVKKDVEDAEVVLEPRSKRGQKETKQDIIPEVTRSKRGQKDELDVIVPEPISPRPKRGQKEIEEVDTPRTRKTKESKIIVPEPITPRPRRGQKEIVEEEIEESTNGVKTRSSKKESKIEEEEEEEPVNTRPRRGQKEEEIFIEPSIKTRRSAFKDIKEVITAVDSPARETRSSKTDQNGFKLPLDIVEDSPLRHTRAKEKLLEPLLLSEKQEVRELRREKSFSDSGDGASTLRRGKKVSRIYSESEEERGRSRKRKADDSSENEEATPTRKKSHYNEEDAKSRHCEIEKKRRTTMNDHFETLKSIIELHTASTPISKNEILLEGIRYIEALQANQIKSPATRSRT